MMLFQFKKSARGSKIPRYVIWANREQRVIITNDKGFGKLIFQEQLPNRGVVLLRLTDERAVNRVQVISDLLATYENRLKDHFVVASEAQVRIRPLPFSFKDSEHEYPEA